MTNLDLHLNLTVAFSWWNNKFQVEWGISIPNHRNLKKYQPNIVQIPCLRVDGEWINSSDEKLKLKFTLWVVEKKWKH